MLYGRGFRIPAPRGCSGGCGDGEIMAIVAWATTSSSFSWVSCGSTSCRRRSSAEWARHSTGGVRPDREALIAEPSGKSPSPSQRRRAATSYAHGRGIGLGGRCRVRAQGHPSPPPSHRSPVPPVARRTGRWAAPALPVSALLSADCPSWTWGGDSSTPSLEAPTSSPAARPTVRHVARRTRNTGFIMAV